MPKFIREIMLKGKKENNIFTNDSIEYNQDYFKTLWGRFKRVSTLIEEDQTLYSFRHSGAIEIFKRTGSITKLQKAMGHSSINVSLTYLRGLEVGKLKEEDMPTLRRNGLDELCKNSFTMVFPNDQFKINTPAPHLHQIRGGQ